jgi:phosphoribosylglycinamide formyltransferase-1
MSVNPAVRAARGLATTRSTGCHPQSRVRGNPLIVTLALGVLISGTGTNLGAVLDAVADGRLDAEVRVVVSNKESAKGLERAKTRGVPTAIVSHRAHPDRESFDRELVRVLEAHGVEHVVLAGFMRVVTEVFLGAFPDRVVNIHPSLLPAFPGVDAQAQALAYGAKVSGCTVHFVDAGVDSGPIIAQRSVPVEGGDDRDALAARILVEEHRLLVDSLAELAKGELEIVSDARSGRRRVIRRARLP